MSESTTSAREEKIEPIMTGIKTWKTRGEKKLLLGHGDHRRKGVRKPGVRDKRTRNKERKTKGHGGGCFRENVWGVDRGKGRNYFVYW